MNRRRVASYIDALLSDRRPAPFKAKRVDADVLGTVIALRGLRPGDGEPDEQFVASLREELALRVHAPTTPLRAAMTRRARLTLAAAAVATMGGTVAATTTLEHALAAAGGPPVTRGQLVRVGNLESPGGHAVGQIVAYRGATSWVLMSIRDPGVNGAVDCRIQMGNGRTAAAGTFVVHDGVGEFARPISVDVGTFRNATLMKTDGSVVATANFPAG